MLDKKMIFWYNSLSQVYDYAYPFCDGVAKVKMRDDYNYINTDGEFVSPTSEQIQKIEDMIEKRNSPSLTVYSKSDYSNEEIIPVDEYPSKYYTDKYGNILFGRYFNIIRRFVDGVAAVQDNEGWKIINEQGEDVATNIGNVVGYSEGWFVVIKGTNEFRYINKDGEYLLKSKDEIKGIISQEPEQFINLSKSILLDKVQVNEYLTHLKEVLVKRTLNADNTQKTIVTKTIALCNERIKEIYQPYDKIDIIDKTNEEEVEAYIKGELSLCQ